MGAKYEKRIPRPWTVAVACAVSLVLCTWDIVWAFSGEELEDVPYFLPLLVALNCVPLVFTVAAYVGRGWGRVGLLVVTALGVLALPLIMLLGGDWAQEMDVETVLYTVAAIAVIALLVLPASGEWYRRARAPAGDGA